MFRKYSGELKELVSAAKTLDFKVVYIFLSVSVIIFLSIAFASPNFYYKYFEFDRFNSRIYWFFADGLTMFLLSVFSIKFVLKEKFSNFGITLGDWRFGLFTTGIFLAVMLPVLWIVSASPEFVKTYPQGGERVSESIPVFLFYQLSILVYMLGWEFLWRGYMLFGLREKFGYYTIFIQMIPFFILHKGKPELELFASIFAGIILGVQALRSGSFFYCWLLHWLVMLFIDSISIFREHFQFYKLF